ncbi:MAG: metallopeptidase family protein [Candidatus Aminicenantia bacterium]
MKREKFEQLVEEVLRSLPKKFKKYLDNLAIIIEDQPEREIYHQIRTTPFSSILGVYHGVPFKYRGPYYGNVPPDVIAIYQKPIERICRTDEEIRKKVKEVVLHEIGHYFGLNEKELEEIEDS